MYVTEISLTVMLNKHTYSFLKHLDHEVTVHMYFTHMTELTTFINNKAMRTEDLVQVQLVAIICCCYNILTNTSW